MLSPCSCKMKCVERIPEERRRDISIEFWSQHYNQRQNWIHQHRPLKGEQKTSHSHLLPTHLGELRNVCQMFFLRTLRYTSNSVLQSSSAGDMFAPKDKSGIRKPLHATPDHTLAVIDEHIESFHLSVSHYRREHAPNRRYLSPELTIREMHSLFKEQHPHLRDNVGCDTYRRRKQLKNVAFTKLGNEHCEQCLQFTHHEHQLPSLDPKCEACQSFKGHKDQP